MCWQRSAQLMHQLTTSTVPPHLNYTIFNAKCRAIVVEILVALVHGVAEAHLLQVIEFLFNDWLLLVYDWGQLE